MIGDNGVVTYVALGLAGAGAMPLKLRDDGHAESAVTGTVMRQDHGTGNGNNTILGGMGADVIKTENGHRHDPG